jgi:hypothetical protein
VAEETDATGAPRFGRGGPRDGGFGPPGFTGRPGWRGGLGRAQQLYDCRPGGIDTADEPAES